MNESDSKPNQNHCQDNSKNPCENQDFFSKLQENEKKKGKDARGKGHGWTTFAEIFMGDW